ncbi:MAG TPA: ATP-binding cassette domain-containing protein [Amycolatopsis sp.]|nr:ATP-binding cassette domain-containing protein [Amycolatopsis sp.]
MATPAPAAPAVPDGQTAEVVLEGRGLSKRFGGLHAVSDVDLTLRAGCVLGIIGPNGAGKSTVVNLLSGMYRADGGSVLLRGKDVSNHDLAARSRCGLVRTFQHTKVLTSFTVGGAMELAVKSPRNRAAARRGTVAALARDFGLAGVLHRDVRELPYGTQKVVNLALVALTSPVAVLLDEPFAGVTRSDIDRLCEVIERLRAAGTAIGLVEHDMDTLMRLSTSVLVLDSGRLVTEGSPADVQADERVRRIYLGRRKGRS